MKIMLATLLVSACRTFPEYSDGAMEYDKLVYASDWRYIVVPKEVERNLPPTQRMFPNQPQYEKLFRQAQQLPLLTKALLNDRSPLTAADFLLECDSLIAELLQIDPIADFRLTSGVKKSPQVYEERDRLLQSLRDFRAALETKATADVFPPEV